MLSPARLRPTRDERIRRPRRASRGRTKKWWTAPQARATRDERDLHEQHRAVALRPEVVQVRDAHEREVRPRGEHERDEHDASLEKRTNALAPQLGRDRPTATASATSPPSQSDAAEKCTQSASSVALDEPAIDRVVAGKREARDEQPSESTSAGHEQQRPLEQPRQVDDRGHEGEPERHEDERLAEARAVGDRRQVAVDVLRERQLQHVLAAQAEARIPISTHAITPAASSEVQPLLDPRRQREPAQRRSRKPSEPISSANERKYSQRTTCSVRVGPPAPYASVGGGACTRTPNVQTPETTWPSAESTCQRTV